MAAMAAMRRLDQNNFSNYQAPCLPNASHQVSAWSDYHSGADVYKDFLDGHYDGHLGNQKVTLLTNLNLYVTLMLPIKFRLM